MRLEALKENGSSSVNYLDYAAYHRTWTNLKPRFQKQYVDQTNNKLIIEGLANLAMKSSENTCDFLSHITSMMLIIKERKKSEIPQNT
jgi:hypothetical protein